MKRYAVIDFSISSISLLIACIDGARMEAETSCRTPWTKEEEHAYNNDFYNIVLEETKAKLETCIKNKVDYLYIIASSTIGSTSGMQEILNKVCAKLNIKINTLSKDEEAIARLSANERYKILQNTVLIDFGSLNSKLYSFSSFTKHIDIGPESLYKEYVEEILPTSLEALAIKDKIKEVLAEDELPSKVFFDNAVLSSVYSLDLYKLYAKRYNIQHEHGEKIIQYKKLKKLCKYLIENKNSSLLILQETPELSREVIPTALLAKEIVKRFNVNNIIISDLGIKEGLIKEIVNNNLNMEGTNLNELTR